MRSAKTAMTSKTSTMTAPNVPSGLRRAARARAELVPDARIEDGIERVHRQVDQDDGGDDDEIDALDDRIVALGDRLEEETPEAGQAEDGLDDHGAAEDLRDRDEIGRASGRERVSARG